MNFDDLKFKLEDVGVVPNINISGNSYLRDHLSINEANQILEAKLRRATTVYSYDGIDIWTTHLAKSEPQLFKAKIVCGESWEEIKECKPDDQSKRD